jgi:L,D-transpeptidase ErfK/SrfK
MNAVLVLLLALGPQVVGGEFTHVVRPGDSFTSIGARFGIEARVIAEKNGLTRQTRLQKGQTLQLNNRHIVPNPDGVEILVNIPQRMLFYFAGGKLSQHYPVAAGRRTWPTSTGDFKILSAEEDPVWDVPLSIQAEMARQGKPVLVKVPPSPENPLGKYWLGTSLSSIGIHGTNAPSSIYSLQTHGCIRLHPDDIQTLFHSVSVGTTGRIIYQPVLIAFDVNGIVLEVHPDTYRLGPDPMVKVREFAENFDVAGLVDWSLVKEVIRKHDGVAQNVSRTAVAWR